MSYTSSFYHIVFRTYRNEQTISTEHERELYAYIYGIARNLKCKTFRIGGMPDHVHIIRVITTDSAYSIIRSTSKDRQQQVAESKP